jgi:hypothetical protein
LVEANSKKKVNVLEPIVQQVVCIHSGDFVIACLATIMANKLEPQNKSAIYDGNLVCKGSKTNKNNKIVINIFKSAMKLFS